MTTPRPPPPASAAPPSRTRPPARRPRAPPRPWGGLRGTSGASREPGRRMLWAPAARERARVTRPTSPRRHPATRHHRRWAPGPRRLVGGGCALWAGGGVRDGGADDAGGGGRGVGGGGAGGG